jgi:hypothetical protein
MLANILIQIYSPRPIAYIEDEKWNREFWLENLKGKPTWKN